MPAATMTNLNHQRGFTLVELIMVIVIMGVIAGMVTVFMKSPIDAYFASGRRAALTDTADTTVRRIARDIQRALPNSIRTSGSQCLEFIPTKTGGRYRTAGTGALNFSAASTSFNMLGSNTNFAGSAIPSDQQIAIGDLIVVYNLGIPGADAYNSDNWTPVTFVGTESSNETPISISSFKFPLESGSYRFQVVPSTEKLVSYMCKPSDSTLHRTVSGTPYSATPSCPDTGPIVASNVNCTSTTFNYSGTDLQRNALVSMVLTIQDSSSTETVSLQHEVHVSNTP